MNDWLCVLAASTLGKSAVHRQKQLALVSNALQRVEDGRPLVYEMYVLDQSFKLHH